MPDIIRKCADEDCIAFKVMFGRCFRQDYKIPLTENQLGGLCDDIASQVTANVIFLDLLIIDDIAQGFVIYQIDSPDSDWCEKEGYGFIRELYVAAERRRAGHGKSLAAHAETQLRDKSVPGIYLTTDEAMDFWGKMGYRDTGEIAKNNGRVFMK